MGAKKKTGSTKPRETKPKVTEVELTEEQEELFLGTLGSTQEMVDDIQAAGTPIREFALALTKLEEAEMWLERGFQNLGFEEADEEDDATADETAEDEEE